MIIEKFDEQALRNFAEERGGRVPVSRIKGVSNNQ